MTRYALVPKICLGCRIETKESSYVRGGARRWGTLLVIGDDYTQILVIARQSSERVHIKSANKH